MPSSEVPPLAQHARTLRDQVPGFVTELVDQVQAQIPALDGRGRRMIEEAATKAANRLLDDFDGLPHRDRGTDALFQNIGRAAAEKTGDLTTVTTALRLGAVAAWRPLRQLAIQHAASTEARNQITDAVFQLVDHLIEQADAGFQAGMRMLANDTGKARARLAKMLLSGSYVDRPDTEADAWEVPDQVVVLVGQPSSQPDVAALTRLGLVVPHQQQIVVITSDSDADQVIKTLAPSTSPVAKSWPVSPGATPAAFRWTSRALDLVNRGVIAKRPVIDCLVHRTQIWLHAEQELRQALAQDLLKPLFAESANSREILSETLLVWLETRDSAPTIASYLGVHPQTVRYRWKRINELFGEDLHDPEFVVQLTMLLKASVPLWRAGDQSDFERYRDQSDVERDQSGLKRDRAGEES